MELQRLKLTVYNGAAKFDKNLGDVKDPFGWVGCEL